MEEAGTTPVTWRKSTRSNGSGNCVEVATNLNGRVGLRDSKDPTGPVLTFGPADWTGFIKGVKSGAFAR